MLNINTNISSLIIQANLLNSTLGINNAVNQLSTGYKVNSAKDNAANFSIINNMTTRIGGFRIAEDNVLSGLDLVNTVSGSLDDINDKLSRLRALAEQAQNGTYGENSLAAVNAEANAIVDEIERLISTTEYNGIKLFGSGSSGTARLRNVTLNLPADLSSTQIAKSNETIAVSLTSPVQRSSSTGFIKEISRRDTSEMTPLSSVAEDKKLQSGTYSISTAEELAKLSAMQQEDLIGEDTEFVLANDIDLSAWCAAHSSDGGWQPIGTNYYYDPHYFTATFDGNGYVINNLTLQEDDNRIYNYGLFGAVQNGCIKNLGIENFNLVSNSNVGALAGYIWDSEVTNCYVSDGNIMSHADASNVYAGGLLGSSSNSTIDSCYASDIILQSFYHADHGIGGLIGKLGSTGDGTSYLTNCFSTVEIYTEASCSGGLVGQAGSKFVIENCYSSGVIDRNEKYWTASGGLVGEINKPSYSGISEVNGIINNCYSFVDYIGIKSILSQYVYYGGLVGDITTGENGIVKMTNSAYISSNCDDIFTDERYHAAALVAYLGNDSNLTVDSCSYNSKYEQWVNSAQRNLNLIGRRRYDYAGNLTVSNNTTNDGTAPFIFNLNLPSIIKEITLQVGISDKTSSQITFNTALALEDLDILRELGKDNSYDYLSLIDYIIESVNAKQTEFGAVENRLMSVLEEISIQYDNLVSSRSTLRDADIAEVSSEYIRQQILQQASATLLATANQSPAIALQLI